MSSISNAVTSSPPLPGWDPSAVAISVSKEGLRYRAHFQVEGTSYTTDAWGMQGQAEEQARQMLRSLAARQWSGVSRSVPMLVRGSVAQMPVTTLKVLAQGLGIRGVSKFRRRDLVTLLQPLLEETPVGELPHD